MSRSFSGINPGDQRSGHGGEARRVSAQDRRPKKSKSSLDDMPYIPNTFDAPPVIYERGEGFFSRLAKQLDHEESLDHDYY